MKAINAKGVTLIALVISIIVMMIIAGISINAVVGDNGIIAQAQDAKMMTELANILFDLESDRINIKIRNKNQRLSKTNYIGGLNDIGKSCTMAYSFSRYGLVSASMVMEDSRIPNMKISMNGDVFVDNYKRGNVQISEYEEVEEVFENMPIKVSDTRIEIDEAKVTLFANDSARSSLNSFDVVWVDENSEVMAIRNGFSFYPSNLRGYAITNLSVVNDEVIQALNNKMIINPITRCVTMNGSCYVETTVFHYMLNKNLVFCSEENGSIVGKIASTYGSMIERVGIVFADNTEFRNYYYLYKENPDATLYSSDDFAEMEHYWMRLDDDSFNRVKQMAKNNNGRVYYCTYLQARQFTGFAYDAESQTYSIRYDSPAERTMYGAIKFLDL